MVGVVGVALLAALGALVVGGAEAGRGALLTFATAGYSYTVSRDAGEVIAGIYLAEACLGVTFGLLVATMLAVLVWRASAWLARVMFGQ
jgi:hypothetical protein